MDSEKTVSRVVLVVDDEPIIRMHAMDMLTDAGFDPVEAGNADEALAVVAARHDISVLFTDINMPGSMDGLDLARRVHELRPDIQLIVTSGKVRPDVDDIPDDGRFIAKPYQEKAFIHLVKAACR